MPVVCRQPIESLRSDNTSVALYGFLIGGLNCRAEAVAEDAHCVDFGLPPLKLPPGFLEGVGIPPSL